MRYHGQLRISDEYCGHTGTEDLNGKRIGGEEMGILSPCFVSIDLDRGIRATGKWGLYADTQPYASFVFAPLGGYSCVTAEHRARARRWTKKSICIGNSPGRYLHLQQCKDTPAFG